MNPFCHHRSGATSGRRLRRLGALALACVLSAPAAAQSGGAFDEAQRAEIKALVRAFILENPEIITEAVQVLQARAETERAENQKTVMVERHGELFDPEENTVIGNPEGDVTIVEFFDYNCGYCKSMFPAMMQALQSDGNVRLVLKEFPILGDASVTASRAALASRNQGKYRQFHLALLGHKGALTEDAVFAVADAVGLDRARLEADMTSEEITAIIDRNRDLARALDISGTPALIIGETFVPGAIGKDSLETLIASARE